MLTAIVIFLLLAALGVLAMLASHSIRERDTRVVTHNAGMLALGLGSALAFACGAALVSDSLIIGAVAAIVVLGGFGLILAPDVRKAIREAEAIEKAKVNENP